jgi:hypothetical protein
MIVKTARWIGFDLKAGQAPQDLGWTNPPETHLDYRNYRPRMAYRHRGK